jgi:hypothetical protein
MLFHKLEYRLSLVLCKYDNTFCRLSKRFKSVASQAPSKTRYAYLLL